MAVSGVSSRLSVNDSSSLSFATKLISCCTITGRSNAGDVEMPQALSLIMAVSHANGQGSDDAPSSRGVIIQRKSCCSHSNCKAQQALDDTSE